MRKLLVLAVFLTVLFSQSVFPSNIDTVKANILRFYTASHADPSQPGLAGALIQVRDSAQKYMDSCRSDGSWADVDYTTAPAVYWPMSTHYIRLLKMAIAYNSPGQGLYHDSDLLATINKGVDFMHRYLYAGFTPVNWWWHCIGYPMFACPTLILMQDHLDSTVFNAACSTLVYFMTNARTGLSGTNGTWIACNHFLTGVITRDSARMAANIGILNNVSSIIGITNDEGILPDFSFHCHGPFQYTAGYGRAGLTEMTKILLYTRGTSFQLASDKRDNLMNFAADGVLLCAYQKYFDLATPNREVTRPGHNAAEALCIGLSFAAAIPNSRQPYFATTAKKMVEAWGISGSWGAALSHYAFADSLNRSSATTVGPVVHRHYPYSDYTINRNAGYFMSVKTLSTRTWGMESTNGEGYSARHYADGMTMILTHGDEYFSHDILAILDWARLPGITHETNLDLSSGYGSGGSSFAGGVTLDGNGVSAMILRPNNSSLTAKKSWFFMNGVMVCLGAAVTCPTPNRAETIINQRGFFTDSTPVYVDGVRATQVPGWNDSLNGASWIYSDSVGYLFPEKGDVKGQVILQTGRWVKLSGSNSNEVKGPLPVLTLYFDHGANANNGSYSYAVSPAKSMAQVQALSQKQSIWVLANDSTVQAVYDSSNNMTGAVFYQPGMIGEIRVDRACLADYWESADSFTIAVADPVFSPASIIHVTVAEPLTASFLQSGVTTAVQGDSTVITFNVDNGGSYHARFARQWKNRSKGVVTIRDQNDSVVAGAVVTLSRAGQEIFKGFSDKQGRFIFTGTPGNITISAAKTSFFALDSIHVVLGSLVTDTAVKLGAAAPFAIQIAPDSLTLLMNDSAVLTVNSLYPNNGIRSCLEPVLWISRSPELVQTDSAGRVRSFSEAGKAVVVCTGESSGLVDSVVVTVLPQQEKSLLPTDDAYIVGYSSVRNGNYNDTTLLLRGYTPMDTGDSYGKYWIYLKFNLTGIDSASLLSAKLRLALKGGANSDGPAWITVFAVEDTGWTEETLTWNNRPLAGAGLDTLLIPLPTFDLTIWDWDVTSWVKSHQGRSMSLFIRNVSGAPGFTFMSKEAASNKPQLVVRENSGIINSIGRESESADLNLTVQPNPFNPNVAIRISGTRASGTVSIYSPSGKWVASLNLEKGGANWNARNFPSGLFIIQAKLGNRVLRTKAILLK